MQSRPNNNTNPRIIPPGNSPEDKAVIDSMLERKKKVQEYDEKIQNLADMRNELTEKINQINLLIADFQRLKQGIL